MYVRVRERMVRSDHEVLGAEEAPTVLGNEIREQESQCVDGRSNVNCDPEEAVRWQLRKMIYIGMIWFFAVLCGAQDGVES